MNTRTKKERKKLPERRQLAVIDNKHVLQFNKLKIEDIKSDYIIICQYWEHGDFYCGRIGQITEPLSFPLQLYKIRSNLSTGQIPMEIDSIDEITALIDPSTVHKRLNKELIQLAVKHRVSFDGLKYIVRKMKML